MHQQGAVVTDGKRDDGRSATSTVHATYTCCQRHYQAGKPVRKACPDHKGALRWSIETTRGARR